MRVQIPLLAGADGIGYTFMVMRLKESEAQAIREAARKHFGPDVRVLLFGSRVDDGKRGGDIDLLVEHDPALQGSDLIKRKLRMMSDIQLAIGDQKIDIVTTPAQSSGSEPDTRLVVKNARKGGVLL
jgi:predicted nucleotidyltransferase